MKPNKYLVAQEIFISLSHRFQGKFYSLWPFKDSFPPKMLLRHPLAWPLSPCWKEDRHHVHIAVGAEGEERTEQTGTQPKVLVSEVKHTMSLYSISKNAVPFGQLYAECFGKCNLIIHPGRKWKWILVNKFRSLLQENARNNQMSIKRATAWYPHWMEY